MDLKACFFVCPCLFVSSFNRYLLSHLLCARHYSSHRGFGSEQNIKIPACVYCGIFFSFSSSLFLIFVHLLIALSVFSLSFSSFLLNSLKYKSEWFKMFFVCLFFYHCCCCYFYQHFDYEASGFGYNWPGWQGPKQWLVRGWSSWYLCGTEGSLNILARRLGTS